MRRTQPVYTLANVMATVVVSALMHRMVSHETWAVWTVIATVLASITAFLSFSRRIRALADREPLLYMRLLSLKMLICGLVWGACASILSRGDHGPVNVLALGIIMGVAYGAIVVNLRSALSQMALFLPVAVSVLITHILAGTEATTVFLPTWIAVCITVGYMSYRVEHDFLDGLRAGIERDALFASERKARDEAAAAAEMERLSVRDALTGLHNRRAFEQRIDVIRAASGAATLLLIDLDNFKVVNDTLGHAAGDRLLQCVAERLATILPNPESCARIGGDEFVVLCDGALSAAEAAALSTRIIDAVSVPLVVAGRDITPGASIGYAVYPRDCDAIDDLLGRADLALYAAKAAGRHRAMAFTPAMWIRVRTEQDLDRDLARAIGGADIELHFQPQVSAVDGHPLGFEGLLRWRHPTRGMIPPPDVVAAAERANLGKHLLRRVIDEACRMLVRLEASGQGHLSVAINCSPTELVRYDLDDLVAAGLAHHQLPPHRLEVEITEEAILDEAIAGDKLRRLAALGVRLAIDDFGTGYSSLAKLREFDFDTMKIDRSFVATLGEAAESDALIRAMVQLGGSLGIALLAEGVETDAQRQTLVALGVPALQGYLFGRPMSAAAALDWLSAQASTLDAGEAAPDRKLAACR